MMKPTAWVSAIIVCIATGIALHGCARQPEPEPKPSSFGVVEDIAGSEAEDDVGAALVLTEEDNGKMVGLRVGETMVVKLEGNLTTGYSWTVDSIDEAVLKTVSSDYKPHPVPEGWTGGGGTRTIRFVALAAGETKLKLAQQRPWEEEQPGNTFEVTVEVK